MAKVPGFSIISAGVQQDETIRPFLLWEYQKLSQHDVYGI